MTKKSPPRAVKRHHAAPARNSAAALLAQGIGAPGYACPVVPRGEAGIRVRMTAEDTQDQHERAVAASDSVARELALLQG